MKMPAPNKAERAKCWTSKDAYWKCLDENPDNQGKCSQLKTDYEGSCSSTWVSDKLMFAVFISLFTCSIMRFN